MVRPAGVALSTALMLGARIDNASTDRAILGIDTRRDSQSGSQSSYGEQVGIVYSATPSSMETTRSVTA